MIYKSTVLGTCSLSDKLLAWCGRAGTPPMATAFGTIRRVQGPAVTRSADHPTASLSVTLAGKLIYNYNCTNGYDGNTCRNRVNYLINREWLCPAYKFGLNVDEQFTTPHEQLRRMGDTLRPLLQPCAHSLGVLRLRISNRVRA